MSRQPTRVLGAVGSHASDACSTPSPHGSVQSVLHVPLRSELRSGQPGGGGSSTPGAPQSHSSPGSITPLPHTSSWQLCVRPPRPARLPSSHPSPGSTIALPHPNGTHTPPWHVPAVP